MNKLTLFDGNDKEYKYSSPTKDPMNIADPQYKPFGRSDSDYSDNFS